MITDHALMIYGLTALSFGTGFLCAKWHSAVSWLWRLRP